MNKEEFIKKLRDSLDLFQSEVIEEEVKKYTEEIEAEQAKGKSSEEIIKNFGSISKIQEKIYLSHGINPHKVMKKDNFFYHQLEELFQVIHHMIDEMGKNDFQNNIKIIFDLVLLLLFICLIKLPFIFIRNLGDSLILYLNIPILSAIWGILIDILYILLAIFVFINIFNKYFKNIKASKKIKGKELEAVNLDDK